MLNTNSLIVKALAAKKGYQKTLILVIKLVNIKHFLLIHNTYNSLQIIYL